MHRYPIADLRAAAHARGCTINDLLIAAVTTRLRELFSERGECQEGLELRASVPVGARGGGNEDGMFIAPLPVGVADDTDGPDIDLALRRPDYCRPYRSLPLVAGVRLSVTGLSYDGQIAVSLLAEDNMPDLPVLAAGVRMAFEGFITQAAHLN